MWENKRCDRLKNKKSIILKSCRLFHLRQNCLSWFSNSNQTAKRGNKNEFDHTRWHGIQARNDCKWKTKLKYFQYESWWFTFR